MAHFAKRVRSIEPSPTVRISDLIAESQGQGKKILSLAIGEPDFPTPAHIVEAAKKALDDGFTKYTAAPGIRELREAIAEKSQKENGIPAKPENVIVAPTKHTLFMTFMALLDPGDEALIPDPGWVSYAPMASLAGAKPVPIRAADEDGFVPSAETVADDPADREGPGTHDHLRDRVRTEGRRRGAPRSHGSAEGDGRRIPSAAGDRPPGAPEDRPTLDGSAEWRVLRVPPSRRRIGERVPRRADAHRGERRGDPGERVR